jgi:hypothetical protein
VLTFSFLQIHALHSAIRTSTQRLEALEGACHVCAIPMLKPILDCSTRWNSTYDMLENSIKLKPVKFLSISCYSG